MQLLENNFRAPGWVAVGADHGLVSSKLLLQINPVRGTILTTTCQFCEFAASSRIAQSGLGSGLGSASKRAGQRIFLPLEGKYLLRSNGSCCSGFEWPQVWNNCSASGGFLVATVSKSDRN